MVSGLSLSAHLLSTDLFVVEKIWAKVNTSHGVDKTEKGM